MAAFTLTPRNLALLKDSVLDLPKSRPSGNFGDFLEHIFAAFSEHLRAFEGPVASLLHERKDRIGLLTESLVTAWRHGWKDDCDTAYSQLLVGVQGVRNELISMSRRHSTNVLPDQSWYRLAAWKGVESRKHMFHTPFELQQKSYRFSTPGTPTLYLANSVFLCWLECGQPCIENCFVSRFDVDAEGFEYLDLPSNHQAYVTPLDFTDIPWLEVDPRRVMNSPYVEDVPAELADYLTGWPIFAAVSVRRLEPATEHTPEYIIPQLLMRWTQESEDFLGIRYFTSKHDPSTNTQDWSVNLALPARMKKNSGYCDFLRARTRCTNPQRLSLMYEKSIQELVTKQAGDLRQKAMGRNIIRWPDGRLEEYCETEYGKMEYWLDRAEQNLVHVEAG